jgi:hypothetical protein
VVVGEGIPVVATGAVGQVEAFRASAGTLGAPSRRIRKVARRTSRHARGNHGSCGVLEIFASWTSGAIGQARASGTTDITRRAS